MLEAVMTAEELCADPAGLCVTPLIGCTGLRLAGDADMCTAGILRDALAGLPPDACEIHLQLASLAFIDVAGTRQILALAERTPRPEVILHCPLPSLVRLIGLMGPGRLGCLRICDGRAALAPCGVCRG